MDILLISPYNSETAIWSNISAAFLALARLDGGVVHLGRLGFITRMAGFCR